MRINLLVWLMLLCGTPDAIAQLRYWCPYEHPVPQDAPKLELLHLSVNRIEPLLRQEQGTPAPLTPWGELEDRQSGPPGRPQRAMVSLPDTISQAAQQAMTRAIPLGGAGCAPVPPHEPGPPQAPGMPVQLALGAFPDAAVVQNFNTVQATLPAPWMIIEGENAFGSDGSVTTCGTGDCHMGYNPSPSGAADADAFITILGLSGNMDVGVRGSGGVIDNTLNVYMVRKVAGLNALRIYRIIANVGVQQGADCTISFSITAGDGFGLRAEGDQLRGYAKSGAAPWALECGPRTEGSITGGGFGLLRQAASANRFDNFGLTIATAAPAARASIGLHLLRGH